MDFSLRCNSLKCRARLVDQAVVTTCSHIFCLPCSETLGLANPDSAARSCPACNTHLANPDDAVVTHLSPTEDYKTSVLSGLTPGVIMECASRGVAFWSYQATQEMHVPATPPRCFGFVGLIRSYSFYQEFLMKSMSEKYQSLSGQMDKLINDANTEISGLRDRLSRALHLEQKDLETKNQELAEAYKKKCKDNGQLHKLYRQAKQKQVSDMMAEAADEDATHVLESLGGDIQARPRGGGVQPLPSRSIRSAGSGELRFKRGVAPAGMQQPSRMHQVPMTPSGHRAQLPLPLPPQPAHFQSRAPSIASTRDHLQRPTAFRQPLGNISPNTFGSVGAGGYGLGHGVKVGRQPQRPGNAWGASASPRTHGVSGLQLR